MSPADGSDVLAAAADYHREKPEYGEFMFPKLFGRIAELYMARYPSLTEHDLARVAVKNYLHAHLNPLAQMRDTDLDFTTASTESQKNWRIAASPLKLYDCSQITDGAASVILCSDRFLDKLGHRCHSYPRSLPTPCVCWVGGIRRIASRWKKRTCRISRRLAARWSKRSNPQVFTTRANNSTASRSTIVFRSAR